MPNEVKNEILLNQYLEILSPSEKETVFQMRDEELKKRALIARVLVRTTISRCMCVRYVTVFILVIKFNFFLNANCFSAWRDV